VTGVILGVGVGADSETGIESVSLSFFDRVRSGCETSFLELANIVTVVFALKALTMVIAF